MSALQTEFNFTLPQGYVDDDGTLHREGTMRLATAADEILPLTDPRVRSNESYLTVVLLARVVTKLGSVEEVTPHIIENLFVSDLTYLQDLYARVNAQEPGVIGVTCPHCDDAFQLTVTPDGDGLPLDGETNEASSSTDTEPQTVLRGNAEP